MEHNTQNQLIKNIKEVNQAVKLIQESINKVDGNLSLLSRAEKDHLIFLGGIITSDMLDISLIIEKDMSLMFEEVPGINGQQLLCQNWMMWIMHTSKKIDRILYLYCR